MKYEHDNGEAAYFFLQFNFFDIRFIEIKGQRLTFFYSTFNDNNNL